MEDFFTVKNELVDLGAQIILLGCTELSVIKRDYSIGSGFLDVMEVLARKSVLLCEGALKEEFLSLIS
jgi:aspartate racemase